MEKYQSCAVWQAPWRLEAGCALDNWLFLMIPMCFSSRSFLVLQYLRTSLHFEMFGEKGSYTVETGRKRTRQHWWQVDREFLYAENGFRASIVSCCCWRLWLCTRGLSQHHQSQWKNPHCYRRSWIRFLLWKRPPDICSVTCFFRLCIFHPNIHCQNNFQ